MAIEIEDASDPENFTDHFIHPEHCEQVACALIGRSACLFEMFVDPDCDDTYYYVNKISVRAEVYRDALTTADKDQYCPHCDGPDSEAAKTEAS